MRKTFWLTDHPQGDPDRGAPFGERCEPTTIALISAVGAAAGGAATLYNAISSKGPGPAPKVEKPSVMPTPDDDAAKAAKRRALAGMSQRKGRQSTILNDDTSSDLLGA